MNEIMGAFQTSVASDAALEEEFESFMNEAERQPLIDTAPDVPTMKLVRRPAVNEPNTRTTYTAS